MMTLNEIYQCLIDTLVPRFCAVCSSPLSIHEKHLCSKCLFDLPRTDLHKYHFNTVEQLFAGKVPIERASGCFFYRKDSPYAAILHHIKYHNMPSIGRWLAALYAREIKGSGFFDGIDFIVPVPLHRWKKMHRGYNQGEFIARGFADVLGVPVVTDLIVAIKEHASQTHKGVYERWLNTQGIYAANNPMRFAGKHILLVDDVITTGATLQSCAMTISHVPGIKISIASLAVAQLD